MEDKSKSNHSHQFSEKKETSIPTKPNFLDESKTTLLNKPSKTEITLPYQNLPSDFMEKVAIILKESGADSMQQKKALEKIQHLIGMVEADTIIDSDIGD